MAYHMLWRDEEYREIGANYLDQLDRERTAKRLVKRLQAFGYIVSVKEQPATILQDGQSISPSSLPLAV
jgi:hypothetical protein